MEAPARRGTRGPAATKVRTPLRRQTASGIRIAIGMSTIGGITLKKSKVNFVER